MTNETFLQKVEQYGGIPEEFYTKEIMDVSSDLASSFYNSVEL